MSHQSKVIEAFLSSKAKRLSVEQLMELTGLARQQVTSAAFQLIGKEIGFNRAEVRGVERLGVYAYAPPVLKVQQAELVDEGKPSAPLPLGAWTVKSAKSAPAEPNLGMITLRIVATLHEGWQVAISEDGKAYRLEKL